MDNFNNNSGGTEPQKPFTEKPAASFSPQGAENTAETPAAADAPGTRNAPIAPDAPPKSENQNGTEFSDASFAPKMRSEAGEGLGKNAAGQNAAPIYASQNNPAEVQNAEQSLGGQYENPYARNTARGYGPQSPYPYRYNSESTQNTPDFNNRPPVPPFPPRNGDTANGGYCPPPAGNYPPGYFQNIAPISAQPPKRKTSGGVIALIIVLCSLLAISVAGLIVYAAVVNSEELSEKSGDSDGSAGGYSITVPNEDNTLPTSGSSAKVQSKTHDESDYSDKTNENYSGIKLQSAPKDASENDSYNASYASEKVSDSVVGVLCYSGDAPDSTDTGTVSSQGSGIILSSDGYIITNSHVIGNSKTSYAIRVVDSDGNEYTAGVVGYDSRTDIAVLKLDDAEGLTPATFGNSDELKVGQDILVVGNPGGLDYQNTTTKGIVSALDRKLSTTSLTTYIQTDAAINPGNSGGPVLNYYGQVVGIASSKIVSETYEGMGFAIPSKTIKSIVDTLIKNGYVEGRVKIGITGSAITSTMSSYYDLPRGIYVQSITSGGPCDGCGISEGDIITKADDTNITSFADMYAFLETCEPGDKVTLTYYSSSTGEEKTAEITLQEDK